MDPEKLENRAKMKPKKPKMEPELGQNEAKMGSRRRKNQKKAPTQQTSERSQLRVPHFLRKGGQHDPNLAPKNEPRCEKVDFEID